MSKRKILPVAAVLAVAVIATVVAAASKVADVRERGELVMLCWPHQESVFVRHMVNELGREGLNVIGGIDVDVMERFARRLGVKLRVQPVRPDFAALIPGLLGGEGDVIASSLSITAARAELVEFSTPYFKVRKVVVARRGAAISSVADLAGKVASVARGTSHEEQLLALGYDDLEILPVQFMLENYQAVAEGRSDFTLVDSSSARRVLAYPDLEDKLVVAFTFPESDYFGFALPPGSELRGVLDELLAEMRASGELDAIVARHVDAETAAQASVADWRPE
ncbi:MAG TPA: transporter substrate-binding domain-containing protein [Thermoanaerobaculia bacterium]|jgi:ABC-type amino acid transport substrate-binding protein